MNSKKSGIYFSQAFKSFISFLLILSMVITPGLLPTVSKAEEKEETEVAENQKPDYLTAEDLLKRYEDATGGLEQTQDYNFDYSKEAPTYGQLSDVKFTQVALGKLGGYALDSSGKVWSWGYNLSGRAGIGKKVGEQMYLGGMMQIPYFIDNNIKVTKIAAGYETGYALDDKGNVYAWGRGSEGQMGDGVVREVNTTPVIVPIPVEDGEKVIDIEAAVANQAHHAVAITNKNKVWFWGHGTGGRIPGGQTATKPTEVKMPFPEGVKVNKVIPGHNFTIALANDGTVWSMGHNDQGQLGQGDIKNRYGKFEKIKELSNIDQIDVTYKVVVAKDKDGNVYEWGYLPTGANGAAFSGQLSPRIVEINQAEIEKVYKPIPQKVYAGEHTNYFIDQKGRTWTWGTGYYYGFAREGGYVDATTKHASKEAVLYPKIIGDGDTQINDTSAKFPKYVTETNSKVAGTKLGYGHNTLHPTAWDEAYMLKDDTGNVLDNDGNQLEYKNGYYYKKGTTEKGMPAIDPNETWISLTFKEPSKMESISVERSSTVFLDADGNIFKASVDGSGTIAWGWDYNDKYFTYDKYSNNEKVGLANSYVHELVFMRGLPTSAPAPKLDVSKKAYINDATEAVKEKTVVKLGDTIKYVISVKNTGNADFTGLSIEDSIDPANFKEGTLVATGTPEGVTFVDGKLAGNFNLAQGESLEITITGVVKSEGVAANTNLQNTVTIKDGEDETPGKTPDLPVESTPGLSVSKEAYINDATEAVKEKTVVKLGDTIKYVISVKNTGNADFTGLSIEDSIDPANFKEGTLVATGTPEGVTFVDGKLAGNFNLAQGESLEITITGVVKSEGVASGTSLKNVVKVTPEGGEEIPGETPEIIVEVPGHTKVDSKSEVKPGEEFDYIITVKNTTSETKEDIVVTDKIDDNLTIVGTTPQGTVNGQNVEFVIASLEPGADTELRITVKVNDDVAVGTKLENVAVVGGEDVPVIDPPVVIDPTEPTEPTEPTDPGRPTPTIKEITLVGGRATLTERVESQLMDFVQYRLSGKDRYGTSVDVAKEYSKSNIVLLASGEKYTDELTATVLANKLGAPIMLTRKDAIPAEVKAEINRLGATKVIIIGGNDSISEKVEKELANYTVERIGGPDRYDTAILVGNQVRALTASKTEAILVDGTDFPDAIAMTSMGVEENMPILLTKPGQLPTSTAKTIEDWKLTEVTIGGGSKSVSGEVEKEVRKYAEVNRIAGADRYETSVLVAEQVYVKPKHAVIASGEVFPDAIVGASYAAKKGYPIVLSRGNNVPDVVMDYVLGNR
ncbi:cell wall-binding repeat-containing protein [Miniphocaeibacter sp.]|uniref:cell wall-binding repeat-containing protein n=2 Tax=Miniphocaeibacter sp. TaxID=3100973 RepID=UPI003BAF8F70